MIGLERFADRIGTAKVTLPDGTVAEARALTAHEDRSIRRAFPRPEPPLKHNPDAGSKAPKIPDERDPAYLAEDEAWYQRQSLMRLLVGLGFGARVGTDCRTEERVEYRADAPDAERLAWLEAAEQEIVRAVSQEWVYAATAEYAGVGFDAALAEAGEGNSGPPSPAAETGAEPDQHQDQDQDQHQQPNSPPTS